MSSVRFKARKLTRFIAIHSSATKPSMDIGASEIGAWHRERGWLGIGYHIVIRRDGTTERGRDIDAVGAHTSGHNSDSIGICMVGGLSNTGKAENNFTPEQFDTLKIILTGLKNQYPDAIVQGHRDFKGTATECPSFDAAKWYKEVCDAAGSAL